TTNTARPPPRTARTASRPRAEIEGEARWQFILTMRRLRWVLSRTRRQEPLVRRWGTPFMVTRGGQGVKVASGDRKRHSRPKTGSAHASGRAGQQARDNRSSEASSYSSFSVHDPCSGCNRKTNHSTCAGPVECTSPERRDAVLHFLSPSPLPLAP